MKHTDAIILEYAEGAGMKILADDSAHELYDDFINEVDGPVKIGGCQYDAAPVLKAVDETAYRCGFNDWLDSEEFDEVGDFYMRRADIETAREAIAEAGER